MSADSLRELFARSVAVRIAVRAARSLDDARRSSAVWRFVSRVGRERDALTPVQRLRLGGLLILTALATTELLLQLVPAQVRPVPPAALRLEIGLAAAIVIAMAPHLVRAWPTSRVRGVLGAVWW